jgi:antitoxin MazE
MQLVIKKWGNSLGVRIPKSIAEAGGLKMDQEINIEAIEGKIVLTPVVHAEEYSLKALLRQCPPESLALDDEDRQWLDDEPVGKEVW